MKGEHIIALGAVAAGAMFWWANQSSGGTPGPGPDQRTGPTDECGLGFAGSQVHLSPVQTGAVVLPHRYPVGIGDNITNMIASGFQGLQIPRTDDFAYFIRPPSEAVL